jgi:hypothetical protein
VYLLDSVSSIAHILVVELPEARLSDDKIFTNSIGLTLVSVQFLISAPIIPDLVKYPANVAFRVNVCSESTFPRLLTRSLMQSLVNFVDEILTDFSQLVHLRDVSEEQPANISVILSTIEVSQPLKSRDVSEEQP